MNLRTTTPFLLIAALALVGAGCGGPSLSQRATDAAIGAATGGKVKVNTGNDQVTYTDKDGSGLAYGDNLTIPDSFPKDVPIYSGAKVKGVTNSTTGSVNATLNLEISDDQTKVANWYDEHLIGAGWTKDSSFDASGTTIRSYSKNAISMAVNTTTESEKSNTTWVTIVRGTK